MGRCCRHIGTWRQIFHWGPILALSVIFMISIVAVECDLMYWPPYTIGGVLNLAVFLTWVSLTLYNYFRAALLGPGFVPYGYIPENEADRSKLQYCQFCEGYKTPRSHHCRKCDRCVMKMDHHCPWINTCCGHLNHGSFIWFLFFAPCGCIHALSILIPSIYKALNFHWYYHYRRNEPLVELGVYGFIVSMFAIGLAIGVIVAVGMLFYIQFKSVWKNETGIESWIIEKASRSHKILFEKFIYPYNLGWKDNLRQVFTFKGRPKSDGYTWEVVDGCDQFTFTVEQIKQKAEKRERTIMYSITKKFSGAMIPLCHGCKVMCCFPCTDEPRIALDIGDKVLVTRWKKHWLYGTKIIKDQENNKRIRGWFPRHCAAEIIGDTYINGSSITNGKKVD
ncbi:hypothetical protein LOTGIDRAFT_223620 [Lottia gigantea]|uniref:Palmitoyltransferase n=1 Tax=Lottia gigantea TaxID=225164 RepID=V3ZMD8_LOTGI|nr:hypothetical protein LOTGIDRAFT_223620 [Lottia gigantea]ESO82001.1 hypothetical protein LOTGIDRAFT_223620 [Lottia gigantea]